MGRGLPLRTLGLMRARRIRAVAAVCVAISLAVKIAGCGGDPQATQTSSGAPASDESVFQLPPGFKTVDIPLTERKDVFKEVHNLRALAVQRANHELPMDEASLPVNDVPAFDKRVADHKAIIDRILVKDLAALAEKYKITVADVEKVEEEARRLRWLPPQEPTLEDKE
jgi:hypothetical protein